MQSWCFTGTGGIAGIVQADDGLPQEMYCPQVPGAGPPEGRGRLHRQEQLNQINMSEQNYSVTDTV